MYLKAIFEEFENYDFSLIYQKNVKNSNTKKFDYKCKFVENFKNSLFKPNLMPESQKLYKMTSLS